MSDTQGYIGLFVVVLLIAGLIGWVKNIFALADCDFQSPYKCEVVHTVGLVPIFGAITGYIDAGK